MKFNIGLLALGFLGAACIFAGIYYDPSMSPSHAGAAVESWNASAAWVVKHEHYTSRPDAAHIMAGTAYGVGSAGLGGTPTLTGR